MAERLKIRQNPEYTCTGAFINLESEMNKWTKKKLNISVYLTTPNKMRKAYGVKHTDVKKRIQSIQLEKHDVEGENSRCLNLLRDTWDYFEGKEEELNCSWRRQENLDKSQSRWDSMGMNSSSIYIRLDPPGVFCWLFSIFCLLWNRFLRFSWPGLQFTGKMNAWHTCAVGWLSIQWGNKNSGRLPMTGNHKHWLLWTVFCSLVHSEKQVRAYIMPFNQKWCRPQNMQAPPVNKDLSRCMRHCITF